jgi:hypothetical protein
MKNRTEKEDNLITDIMKDFEMESPSDGFTERVMQSIELEPNLSTLKSSPLISRTSWIGIAASLLALLLYLYFGYEGQSQVQATWMNRILSSPALEAFKVSITDFFGRINLGGSVLFWILVGTVGILLLAVLERFLETSRKQQFLVL